VLGWEVEEPRRLVERLEQGAAALRALPGAGLGQNPQGAVGVA
jgi:hypothetical protein